ncbi:Ras GTPase activating protein ira2 [Puccinia graminis f. sp. tritici]|uniref:Ras GTPase activating protein ira2 n=1 Tax=Puccinia graminis f. sp. tritici TaxID=56615 RepID=A0A5B0LMY8_PUCGR|nr:Ras GTPase activating protein ira2 [Puccinia graminis f. sp. tritici]KAA1065735.1 Ras GTPase activating protein ira2 [Puccinia graminis f. sp. tritici]
MRTSENTQLLNVCQTVMFPHHPRVKGSQFLARLTDGLESQDFISILNQLGFSGLLLHKHFVYEVGNESHHQAQTEAIHILMILVQVLPLFVWLFLSHPDFDARRTPSSHPIFPPSHCPPPQGEEEGGLLVVMLTLFENLDSI